MNTQQTKSTKRCGPGAASFDSRAMMTIGISVAVGAAIGAVLGAVTNDMKTGVACGVSAGAAFGGGLAAFKKDKSS